MYNRTLDAGWASMDFIANMKNTACLFDAWRASAFAGGRGDFTDDARTWGTRPPRARA